MITAVDTSVLIDVFSADETFAAGSAAVLRQARRDGQVLACEVIWAEIAAAFRDTEEAGQQLDDLGVKFSAISRDAAMTAGAMWRSYRRQCGPRERVTSDFLVGAHALKHADRLLTRDGGFHRTHFGSLTLLEPLTR